MNSGISLVASTLSFHETAHMAPLINCAIDRVVTLRAAAVLALAVASRRAIGSAVEGSDDLLGGGGGGGGGARVVNLVELNRPHHPVALSTRLMLADRVAALKKTLHKTILK